MASDGSSVTIRLVDPSGRLLEANVLSLTDNHSRDFAGSCRNLRCTGIPRGEYLGLLQRTGPYLIPIPYSVMVWEPEVLAVIVVAPDTGLYRESLAGDPSPFSGPFLRGKIEPPVSGKVWIRITGLYTQMKPLDADVDPSTSEFRIYQPIGGRCLFSVIRATDSGTELLSVHQVNVTRFPKGKSLTLTVRGDPPELVEPH